MEIRQTFDPLKNIHLRVLYGHALAVLGKFVQLFIDFYLCSHYVGAD